MDTDNYKIIAETKAALRTFGHTTTEEGLKDWKWLDHGLKVLQLMISDFTNGASVDESDENWPLFRFIPAARSVEVTGRLRLVCNCDFEDAVVLMLEFTDAKVRVCRRKQQRERLAARATGSKGGKRKIRL